MEYSSVSTIRAEMTFAINIFVSNVIVIISLFQFRILSRYTSVFYKLAL
jgi:hypothetical protein